MSKFGSKWNCWLLALVCACGLGVALADAPEALAAEALTTATWTAETVESPNDLSWDDPMDVSLAYDPGDGQPSIAYVASSRGALKFAHWTGSSWAIEVVDRSGVNYANLAYDAPGVPAIAYRRGTELKFAKKLASAWSFQLIDRNTGLRSSLAYDPLGRPAIAYMVGGKKTNVCKLARWSGSLWTYEVFDNAYCACVSLAFKGDFPAVAYNDIVGGGIGINTLKYAEKKLVGNSVEWVKEVVVSGNYSTGSVCDLAIAPDGSPAIVHSPGNIDHPVLVQKTVAGWQSEDIESCRYCGINPELVFHGATPWVSYVNDTPEEPGLYRVVKAAYRDAAGQWIVERVESDPVNLNAWHSSIAFPPSGDQPGVAHMFPSYALRFARRMPTP